MVDPVLDPVMKMQSSKEKSQQPLQTEDSTGAVSIGGIFLVDFKREIWRISKGQMGIDLRGICAGIGDYFGDIDGENVFLCVCERRRVFVAG